MLKASHMRSCAAGVALDSAASAVAAFFSFLRLFCLRRCFEGTKKEKICVDHALKEAEQRKQPTCLTVSVHVLLMS